MKERIQKLLVGSRRKRISKGAGVDVSKINKLLKQFKMMSDMMKKCLKEKNSIRDDPR